MRVRESSMPERYYWESLFDVPLILDRLGVSKFSDVAECGCGYGTFSVPVAERIGGTLYAFDIEPEMVATTLARFEGHRVIGQVRDVVAEGFGVAVDAVLLFNILHGEDPVGLLRQSAAALRPDGRVLATRRRHASRAKSRDPTDPLVGEPLGGVRRACCWASDRTAPLALGDQAIAGESIAIAR